MTNENINVNNPRLNDCPIVLTVDNEAEAVGISFLSTLPSMILLFGEENNPNPKGRWGTGARRESPRGNRSNGALGTTDRGSL